MGEQVASGTGTDTTVVTEAYAAARELLRRAEEDAARIREEADRYMRQREQEAELLVAKARRLLTAAQERVRERAAPVPTRDPRPVDPEAWSLDADLPPAPAVDRRLDLDDLDDDVVPVGSRHTRSELDAILATAIGNAVHRALPPQD